ncbi:hypothetical protein BDZ45DRAFT_800657 [Acephala macrosclerotiorum]|nr:hypothetical protein BDZ45DRAFT_800657 [Acephala macrosclerotiorum]
MKKSHIIEGILISNTLPNFNPLGIPALLLKLRHLNAEIYVNFNTTITIAIVVNLVNAVTKTSRTTTIQGDRPDGYTPPPTNLAETVTSRSTCYRFDALMTTILLSYSLYRLGR